MFLSILHVLQCAFLIFHPFQCFSLYFMSNSVCVSFFTLFSFLVSGFFSFFTFLNVSRHIPGPTVCAFHFPNFSVYSSYSRSYRVHFSFSTLFNVFLPYSRSNNVCVSFFTFFIFLAVFQVLQCAFLIFHLFQCFLLYSMSNSVFILFFSLFSFLKSVFFSHFPRFFHFFAINPVLECLFFPPFQFSHHISRPTVCVFHFPKLSFLAIFQVRQYAFLIFHLFQCFSPQCRSYTVFFSFFTFFSVFCHISHHTVCVSHFP